MLEASHVLGGHDCSHVFDGQEDFGGQAVRREEGIERRAQELAVDEELERDGGWGREQVVHESGEVYTAEVC